MVNVDVDVSVNFMDGFEAGNNNRVVIAGGPVYLYQANSKSQSHL